MKAFDLLELLKKSAQNYRIDAPNSLIRNNHMNELMKNEEVSQHVVDAVLVDFVNHIAAKHGIDYALYTLDLVES